MAMQAEKVHNLIGQRSTDVTEVDAYKYNRCAVVPTTPCEGGVAAWSCEGRGAVVYHNSSSINGNSGDS